MQGAPAVLARLDPSIITSEQVSSSVYRYWDVRLGSVVTDLTLLVFNNGVTKLKIESLSAGSTVRCQSVVQEDRRETMGASLGPRDKCDFLNVIYMY